MKAWRVNEWCEPEQMKLEELPLPEPGPGEVRIRNRAAALNFFDILMIQGKYQDQPPLPSTPGSEFASTIDAIGTGVTGFSIDDRVQATISSGGYAQYVLAPAGRTLRIPDKMSFEAAAAMLVIYQTSFLALTHRTRLRAGEWLLIHAAAGGVGLAALQIGKALGARLIATAGSEEKLEICLAQGAERALNYCDKGWAEEVMKITSGHGVDVIYDPVGGDIFDLSSKCIAPEGRLLVVGFAGGRIPTIAANRILLKNISVIGCYFGLYLAHHPPLLAEAQAELFRMYEAGQINPVIWRTYPLADAVAALRALAGRQTYGKVVLTTDA